MSASSPSLPFLVPNLPASNKQTSGSPVIRRRPTMQQGRALETLGHAIEYLIDSRMFLVNEPYTSADAAAVQQLSLCSREVFATCAEIVPVSTRLRLWAIERLRMGTGTPMTHSSAH